MKLSIGIIGLPNVGKSTLFQALTKKQVNIANYPFTTIDPNVGVVAAKDERLEQVAKVMKSKEIFPAVFEFIDIAGLAKDAHKGAGLGNQFLACLRECDAIIHLVRIFKDESVIYYDKEHNPIDEFEIILAELKLKDEESKEKINLLSKKPQLIILNGEEGEIDKNLIKKIEAFSYPYLVIDLKNELPDKDLKAIFENFHQFLGLITFYTANENEARSWFIKKGTKAPQAAGVVHTDFEKNFIKAEVINWQKLIEVGDWHKARQKGLIKVEGKDYIVQDGDVMLIKHS